jgi:hypothetical protein
MKKLLIILLFSFYFTISSAFALTVAWDQHTDPKVLGYTLYWQERDDSEAEIFIAPQPGIETTQYIIEDKFLKISIVYNIWATAYNDQQNSENSEVITATRDYTFSPPVSNLPTVEYDPEKPTKITINATP